MSLIEVGRKAPAFTLPDQDGAKHALKDLAGSPVILFFYPKDDTSGCTKEACQFRDQLPDFKKVKTRIFGISPDSVESHRKFVDKHELNFTLLADAARDGDENPKICLKYGVWQEKSMYGRKYMGVVRTTYLIGPDGKVAERWDKVKVPGHADAVLEAVRGL
ncbi:MAG: thioredoxin-dependent thiol peroxidase [Phycisphaerae bacterium]|nr:thioredoxin-dependent thiol peroxidase [Phycisphaerae bacterium]